MEFALEEITKLCYNEQHRLNVPYHCNFPVLIYQSIVYFVVENVSSLDLHFNLLDVN